MEVIHYKNNERENISSEKIRPEIITRLLEELVSDIEEITRVYVDSERLEEIKAEEALEFVFEKEVVFNSGTLGEFRIMKLLIPLKGDFAPAGDESFAYLFIGNGGYDGSPYMNPSGKETVQKILEQLNIN